MKQVENRHLTDVWAVLVQGHGRIIAPDFYVAHREANSGLSTLNRTKTILSIYHQQRQLQKQRGMCLNDTYPFCQQPLSGNCHSICFSKPVLWTATPRAGFFISVRNYRYCICRNRAYITGFCTFFKLCSCFIQNRRILKNINRSRCKNFSRMNCRFMSDF